MKIQTLLKYIHYKSETFNMNIFEFNCKLFCKVYHLTEYFDLESRMITSVVIRCTESSYARIHPKNIKWER